MKVLGITGGMGSGKTTVAEMLAEKGVPVFNADNAVKRLQEPGMPAAFYMEAEFGSQFFKEGVLDKPAFARYAFENPAVRQRLEELLFPLVGMQMEKERKLAEKAGHQLFVIDAPLLIESGLHRACHEVWLVTAPLAERLARIKKRSNLTEEDIMARIGRQMTDREKAPFATHIIDNTDANKARQQVELLYGEIQKAQ